MYNNQRTPLPLPPTYPPTHTHSNFEPAQRNGYSPFVCLRRSSSVVPSDEEGHMPLQGVISKFSFQFGPRGGVDREAMREKGRKEEEENPEDMEIAEQHLAR
jgi:hypothetical protein